MPRSALPYAPLALLVSILSALPALARLAPADYEAVGLSVAAGRTLPMAETVKDEDGQLRKLNELIARPTVLVFADYTCRTLCGPTVAFVAMALEKSGLKPDRFQLLVVGLNPQDTATDAAHMRRDHLGGNDALAGVTRFVTADDGTVQRLTAALGYRYRYDAESGQYVHPAAAFVLTEDGRLARALTGLGLSGADVRLALVEASAGNAGTLGDEVRLLCSAFDPAHGTYDLVVSRVLAAAGLATVVLMGAGLGFLLLAGRRAA
jgi:protein SCO1/2